MQGKSQTLVEGPYKENCDRDSENGRSRWLFLNWANRYRPISVPREINGRFLRGPAKEKRPLSRKDLAGVCVRRFLRKQPEGTNRSTRSHGGLNGSSQHSRKACLQEFQNATFFEGIELTAWPFKRAKNQPFSLQRTRKVRTERQNHLFIRNFQIG